MCDDSLTTGCDAERIWLVLLSCRVGVKPGAETSKAAGVSSTCRLNIQPVTSGLERSLNHDKDT
jgi:hypothetical protein